MSLAAIAMVSVLCQAPVGPTGASGSPWQLLTPQSGNLVAGWRLVLATRTPEG